MMPFLGLMSDGFVGCTLNYIPKDFVGLANTVQELRTRILSIDFLRSRIGFTHILQIQSLLPLKLKHPIFQLEQEIYFADFVLDRQETRPNYVLSTVLFLVYWRQDGQAEVLGWHMDWACRSSFAGEGVVGVHPGGDGL